MKILGVIPTRYASTRFPGKPLTDIGGKSMIQRVYEQSIKASVLSKIVIATDDERIFRHAENFSDVIMTRPDHPSGTDRCLEALEQQQDAFDYVINIQGDEPFIDPIQIETLATELKKSASIATLAKPIETETTLNNPNIVKVVITADGHALYFSRAPIPYNRNAGSNPWTNNHSYLKHIGLYGYHADTLRQICKLPVGKLEQTESLEQLRWLEYGYQIRVGITDIETIGIDTPEDLEKIKGLI